MKLIILSVGLFCLLFFNYEGITTTQNPQSVSIAYNSYFFESGLSDFFCDVEYVKTGISASSDQQLSLKKKRTTETNPKFSNVQKKVSHSDFKLLGSSNINLFLIFHHSLSLWQVFLQ